MKFTDKGSKEFEQAPAGNFYARCVRVIDMGTQENEYEGKVTFPHQVAICWELPTELMTEGEFAGKPFIVTKIYTASLSEKARLREHLESWRGRAFTSDELRGFDSKNILGKPCLLAIKHSEKGKAQISGVAPVPKGMEVHAQVNPNVYFSLDPLEFSAQAYANLSKWYQEKIAASPEYLELTNRKAAFESLPGALEELEDDIAF